MKAWRGILAAALAALGLCLAPGAGAVEAKEGIDFRIIKSPLAAETNKIEVTEFFWYGCSHCSDVEPVLAAWVKRLPPDVSFRRVPALYPNDKWLPGARLYYTLEAMNQLERLHGEAFNAIHVERQRLDDPAVLREWLAKKDVDVKQFTATASSFGVQSRLQQARRLTLAAAATSVPALMVQGRYLALKTGSSESLLATADQLIARIRAEGSRK